MTKHARALLAAAAVVALVLATACGGGSKDEGGGAVGGGVGLSLALASNQVAAGDAIPLTVTLHNDGNAAVTVARPALVPYLVFLEVTRDGGDPVPFDGPWLNPRPLARDAFVELAAGESVDHDFDLADFYTLDAGTYTVVARYQNPQDGGHVGLSALVIDAAHEVSSDAVTLEVQ